MKRVTVLGVGALVLSLGLTACGGEEAKPAPATPVQAEPTPAAEPVTPVEEVTTETAEPEAKTDEVKAEEAKAEEVKAEEASAKENEAPLAADAGKKRYDATCHACHAQGLLDAPKLTDKAAWQTRLTKGKDTLYTHSVKGFNKMPAQAVGDISEAEVKAAVDYMLEQAGVS